MAKREHELLGPDETHRTWQERLEELVKQRRALQEQMRGQGKGLPYRVEFFADSAAQIQRSVDNTGLRSALEDAFREAIDRAKNRGDDTNGGS